MNSTQERPKEGREREWEVRTKRGPGCETQASTARQGTAAGKSLDLATHSQRPTERTERVCFSLFSH